MKKREKWFMIILWTVVIICFVMIPIGKGIYGIYEDKVQEKRAEAYRYKRAFSAVEIQYTPYLNITDKGYMQEPYFLNKEDISINSTILQMKVNSYNNDNKNEKDFKAIEREEIEKEFKNMLETDGEIGETLLSFTAWDTGTTSRYSAYRADLGGLLDLYTNKNPKKFPDGKILEELTPEQINILDEVYRGEKTIEEIEL